MSQIEESIEGAGSSEQAASPNTYRKLSRLHSPASMTLCHIGWLGSTFLLDTNQRTTAPSFNSKTLTTLSPSELNLPDVQKIVVEHIVRSEDKPSHSHPTLRLRAFSGKIPRPYSEVDYDTWRSHVDFMMKDVSVSDLEKTRKILESSCPSF